MVRVQENGQSRQTRRDERFLTEHLVRAENGVKPIVYAKGEYEKYKNTRAGNGSELSIDMFHVRPTPELDHPTSLLIDMRLRVDRRIFPRRKGSFIHNIAVTIELPQNGEPFISETTGIVGRDTKKDESRLNIPKSLTFMNRATLERDLAFIDLRLQGANEKRCDIPLELRMAISTAFKTFIDRGQAARFPQIIPSVLTSQAGQNPRGLAD